jgi:hypothetical protein
MKAELLKKMKYSMPAPASRDEMLDADSLDLEAPAEASAEPGPLDAISDEDLLAEVRKRGLSVESEASPADREEDALEG